MKRNYQNYQEKIETCMLDEVKRANEYLNKQYEEIEKTNTEINKIKTEFILIKLLIDSNYELIRPSIEINSSFNYINIIDIEEVIKEIALEIEHNYQHLFIKERNEEKIFDFEAIRKIALFILSSYKLLRLLNKFKRKDKNDFQPLKSYINSLTNIIDNTLNESLKNEAKKELEFFKGIQIKQKMFTKNDEIYEILEHYNNLLVDIGNQRSKFYNFKPSQKLNKNTCRKLEKFIKLKLQQVIPKY
ncbi:hypothetical protein Arnit_0613 [Arcobacter nitrofigilis DSM 7299]|uniref:Uncharacterized protein n=1 Tax=Arcobacter nitrofigilis (strain ATCC 33309 / DSM 7299 / CCUG 15893 / LMG 7604 / NCTC 12251 / CI) TaxID=572480 RepID=D5V245_ARCNC|nr:hypothetical protein [Arcobacter nitrofigilis]ADG92278.1 hypothetical protein Arnit_0613 [Arcobacter nitrofigilis DSM 7299]